MTFREVVFPTAISLGAIGGPGFNTDVVTVHAGREKRNANWSEMRHEYEVSYGVKSEEQFKTMRAFFLAQGGKRDGFLFKDWADYIVAITEGVVEGIDSTHFQLQKKYASGSTNTLRDIEKPIASKFVLKNSGTTLTLTTDYTISATTGIVTTMAPRTAANLTWSGEFYVPARFDVDKLRARVVNKNESKGLLLAWESIPVVELKGE